MNERLVIVGGVAAGATAAARARRKDESVKITVLERGPYVSFANCGLPYFISGDIEKRDALILQTPESLKKRYDVDVLLETEALSLDLANKRIQTHSAAGTEWIEYDRLILAQGGSPIVPPLPGVDLPHVFKLWTIPDMDRIDRSIAQENPRTAVVVGGGFIGIEMAEALARRGLKTTVVELADQILGVLDFELANRAKVELARHGVSVRTGAGVRSISPQSVELSNGESIDADVVLLSIGVVPELRLAKEAGLKLGETGALEVDRFLRTSDPHVWAAGDMVEVRHRIAGKTVRLPLAGPANRQGRIAATNALEGSLEYRGANGTSVVKVFDLTAAATGLSEKAAARAGFRTGVAIVHKDHHAGYYPGAQLLTLKLVYDTDSRRLLGAQAIGAQGVDKRIDVLSTALHGAMTIDDLAELDLSYAPPYSSANDPVNLAAFVAQNDVDGDDRLVTPWALAKQFDASRDVLLDVRTAQEFRSGHVPGAINVPVDDLRRRISEIPKDRTVYVHCRVGFRGHLAAKTLVQNGYRNVRNVTGGFLSMQDSDLFQEEKGE